MNTWKQTSSTPTDPNHRISQKREGSGQRALSMIGGKVNLPFNTQPNIACAKSVVSYFMYDPKEERFQAAQKILQYLKPTPRKGILFKKSEGLTIYGYTDANYVGSLTHGLSTAGYCTYIAENLITRRS